MARKAKQVSGRTALLIHCSRQEAEQIRRAAKKERRTISGFVLNAVLSKFELEERLEERRQNYREAIAEARRTNVLISGNTERASGTEPK